MTTRQVEWRFWLHWRTRDLHGGLRDYAQREAYRNRATAVAAHERLARGAWTTADMQWAQVSALTEHYGTTDESGRVHWYAGTELRPAVDVEAGRPEPEPDRQPSLAEGGPSDG